MIGTLLNERYRLDARVGGGGMGIVYRGQDLLLDRTVAVKVFHQTGMGLEARERLLREAQAAAQLNHPNIVSVYDAGQADDRSYIVMEYVQGESLYIRRPRSLEEILSVACQICAALEHAHRHGIVHRDLKPENVLITNDGTAKLTDFGLARSVASRVTTEGTIIGTLFYLAPETARGDRPDGRADLYALGVMLYDLVTGQLPFTAEDPLALISQHLYSPVVPPRAIKPSIPAALDSLIVRLLSKQPQDRPSSAVEVSRTLSLLDPKRATPAEEPALLERLVRGRLVGRERELTELTGHWQHAMVGEGHVLLISGEPGIGKTRLARELVTLCQVMRGQALVGECYAEGGGPYGPIVHLLRDTLAQPGGVAAELPEYVLTGLSALFPELRSQYNLPPGLPLDPGAEQQRLFDSVVALCSALAARAPLLLLVDDIHWADSGTLFLLRHLARRAREQRILLVLTYREVELDQSCCVQDVLMDLNRERLAARLKLGRLNRKETGEMLATMLAPGGEIEDALVEAIYAETEGNPFFTEEVCKALIEEGQLCHEEGRWKRQGTGPIEIPQSVRLTVQARLSKLQPETQEVLRLASVLGREFEFETLAGASEAGEEELIEALEEAERAQLVEEETRGKRGALVFRFAHALIPTALRESIGRLRRQRLHRRALAALEQQHPDDWETLAYHAEEAGDAERARTYYQQAGDRALELYANQEAERHYRTALDTISEPDKLPAGQQAHLLSELGEALFRQSRYSEAVATWQEAISRYQAEANGDKAAYLYARAARAAWFNSDFPGSLAICQEGMDALAGQMESPGTAALLHETGRAYYFNALFDESLVYCRQALEMAERLGAVEVQAEALSTIGISPKLTTEEARQALTRAIELSESAGLPATASRAYVNLGSAIEHRQGNPRAALERYNKAAELAQQIGATSMEFVALSSSLFVLIQLGEYDAVEKDLEKMRQMQNRVSPHGYVNFYMVRLAANWLHHYRGEWEEAIQGLQACREEARQQGNRPYELDALMAMTEVYTEMGRWEEAESCVLPVLEKTASNPGGRFSALLVFFYVRIGQGRVEEARQIAAEMSQLATNSSSPALEVRLARVEATLAAAQERWAEADVAFERCIALNVRLEARWYQASVLRQWGETFLRRRPPDPVHGCSLLEQASDVWQKLGVPRYVVMVEERIRQVYLLE